MGAKVKRVGKFHLFRRLLSIARLNGKASSGFYVKSFGEGALFPRFDSNDYQQAWEIFQAVEASWARR